MAAGFPKRSRSIKIFGVRKRSTLGRLRPGLRLGFALGLARLRLGPEELETFTGQLSGIVDFMTQLQELDTTGLEPLSYGI